MTFTIECSLSGRFIALSFWLVEFLIHNIHCFSATWWSDVSYSYNSPMPPDTDDCLWHKLSQCFSCKYVNVTGTKCHVHLDQSPWYSCTATVHILCKDWQEKVKNSFSRSYPSLGSFSDSVFWCFCFYFYLKYM